MTQEEDGLVKTYNSIGRRMVGRAFEASAAALGTAMAIYLMPSDLEQYALAAILGGFAAGKVALAFGNVCQLYPVWRKIHHIPGATPGTLRRWVRE